jgi:hypothetical protein
MSLSWRAAASSGLSIGEALAGMSASLQLCAALS